MTTPEQTLAKAERTAEQWRTEHDAKMAELDRVKSMTDLDPDEDPAVVSVRVAEQILELATAVDVAAAAITTADGQVDAARRALMGDRAAAIRARSVALRAAASGHEAVTRELLAKLTEHDGVEYAPPHPAFTNGQAMRRYADSLATFAAEEENRAQESTPAQIAVHVNRPQPDFHQLERRFVPGVPAADTKTA